MDLKEKMIALAERVARQKNDVMTEEATKTSFILPFLHALGYDIFDPAEVRPEADCDFGKKKGLKVDYTISINGTPVMLIECKHWSVDLDKHKAQLFHYYSTSNAKFGILTNGIVYKFFTDLDKDNLMDEKPFFEINLVDLKDSHIEKLKEFSRDCYCTSTILSYAKEMKYVNAFRTMIGEMAQNPSEEFAKIFIKQVYDKPITKNAINDYTPLLVRAFQQYINDNINDRLKQAITPDIPSVDTSAKEDVGAAEAEKSEAPKIVTTDEEQQGYYIVCAILGSEIDLSRIVMRDAQSYCAILFDNNNRKPICRLHFNGSKKYVETFDADKVGIKHPINSLNDIYKLSNELLAAANCYL